MIRFTLLILLFQISDLQSQTSNFKSPLGLPDTLTDLYIPGSQIEVIPRKNNEASLVIRILEIKPASEGFRYKLEVYALDPGTHNLADFLRYTDTKAPLENLDATFTATTIRPLDTLPKPSEPEPVPPGKLGGYQTLIITLGILWLGILLAIIFYRKKKPAEAQAPPPPPTLHEKIQSLVSRAAEGQLPDQERAQLERLILGHWKTRIPQLASLPPAKALVELRTHPEASPLVLKLEEWLHAPNPTLSQSDLSPLLTPYLPKN